MVLKNSIIYSINGNKLKTKKFYTYIIKISIVLENLTYMIFLKNI